jgi:ssDNA-binding Zn-finger/Zn-ribbon topoisomerase 1
MAITIKCPDCGHTKQSDDGEPETCPECEGTMAPPAKKKYQAKSTSLEEEAKKKKRDDEDEDAPKKKDKPKPKRKTGEGGSVRDGTQAEALELNPGFGNSKLMTQVEDELSRGEVLHWAGRMCPEIARKNANVTRIVGIVFAVAGLAFTGIVLAVAPGMAKLAAIVPVLFIVIGVVVAALIPGKMVAQAGRSWYAVTNQRCLVYSANLFGESGETTTYEPEELKRMRVEPAKAPKGAGDLVFKKTIVNERTDYVDRKTGRTVRSETSQKVTKYGFLGIEDVREVEALIHKVLLGEGDDDE